VPMFSGAPRRWWSALDAVRPRCRCGPGGAAARGTARRLDRYRLLKAARRALDYVDLLLIARISSATPTTVRASSSALRTHLRSTSSRTRTRCRPKSCCCSRRRPERARLDPRPARPRQALHRRDPKQVDLIASAVRTCRCTRTSAACLTQHGVRPLELTTSFRSVAGDPAARQRPRSGRHARKRHDAAGPLRAVDRPPAASGSKPSVVALPVPRPYGKKRIAGTEIETLAAGCRRAFVNGCLRDSGWFVTERESGKTVRGAVQARHVCILFRPLRQLHHRCHARLRRMRSRRAAVKHLLVGGRAFHNRERSKPCAAALAAVEWRTTSCPGGLRPLRGALFAIGDEELLEYHHHYGRSFPAVQDPRSPARAPDADR